MVKLVSYEIINRNQQFQEMFLSAKGMLSPNLKRINFKEISVDNSIEIYSLIEKPGIIVYSKGLSRKNEFGILRFYGVEKDIMFIFTNYFLKVANKKETVGILEVNEIK